MKTVSEIQDALNAVTRQLTEISNELNELKTPVNTAETGISFNTFAAIEAKAKSEPIRNLALSKATIDAKQTYMRFLSALAGAHEERLLFARRIGLGSGSDWTAERIAAEKSKIGGEFPLEISKNLSGLCNSLLLDSLVMVYSFGKPDDETLDLIASALDILNYDDKDTAVVSQLAAAIVQNDKTMFDSIECEKAYPGLSHFIPKEWIEIPLFEKTSVCVSRHNSTPNYVPNGWIKKGEFIYSFFEVYMLIPRKYSTKKHSPVNGFFISKPYSNDFGQHCNFYIYHPFYEGPEVK